MSAELAPRPAHVPAELVFDFDVHDPPGAADDYHAALKQLHTLGVPDIFWTRRKGGHWVATRGECDFVTDFAQHLPIQVFVSIVDVPAEQIFAIGGKDKTVDEEWLPRIPDFEILPGSKPGLSAGVNGTIYSLPLRWDT